MRHFLLPAGLLLIASTAAADTGPYRFACADGSRFTLAFHDGGTATLDLAGMRETLTQQPMGSGIVYAGPRHTYREHQGQSQLDTAGGTSSACRREGT